MKTLSLLGAAGLPLARHWRPNQPAQSDLPNILIVLFDTFAAKHMSLYGYPRETTPFISRFAERAHVYHNHYSTAPYTTPGTASLLTGVYPWKHRAFDLAERVHTRFSSQNLFSYFNEAGYYQTAYTHNPLADVLLSQFDKAIDDHIDHAELMVTDDVFFTRLLGHDLFNAQKTKQFLLIQGRDTFTSSLLYSPLIQPWFEKRILDFKLAYKERFPLGLPRAFAGNFILLEDAVARVVANMREENSPFLGYYHLLPPHAPYKPTGEAYLRFLGDAFDPPKLADHKFTDGVSWNDLRHFRREYDEFILYVDEQFNALIDQLEADNSLENTIVILTSDHGELFERGIWNHLNPALLEGVLRIPLMIHMPGQTKRVDVHTRTSSVDVLATLMHLTRQAPPAHLDGVVLPPFNDSPIDVHRAIYAMVNFEAPQFQPLNRGTFSILQDDYKLNHYLGYETELDGEPWNEVYNIALGEERENVFNPNNPEHRALLEQLNAEIQKANDAGYHKR